MARSEGNNPQVREIAKTVAAVFAVTLTEEEKQPRQIAHPTLPWTVPPLVTPLIINNREVQSLLDMPVQLEADELAKFWRLTLHEMWHTPGLCMKKGIYRHLTKLMPYAKYGTRAFRFSEPLGFPGQLDIMSGVIFSLEVAHLALTSTAVMTHVSDDDNYYVVLKSGETVGVKGGKPATPCDWEFDATGMVPVLLEAPRGETSFACQFDQIAHCRSLLHQHREKFDSRFDALNQLLQALRYLTIGGDCPSLLMQMKLAPEDVMVSREKLRIYIEALDAVDADIPDRSKLYSLQALLVPVAMTMTGFRRAIFSSPDYPFTLEPGKLARIKAVLQEAHDKEAERCSPKSTA